MEAKIPKVRWRQEIFAESDPRIFEAPRKFRVFLSGSEQEFGAARKRKKKKLRLENLFTWPLLGSKNKS